MNERTNEWALYDVMKITLDIYIYQGALGSYDLMSRTPPINDITGYAVLWYNPSHVSNQSFAVMEAPEGGTFTPEYIRT